MKYIKTFESKKKDLRILAAGSLKDKLKLLEIKNYTINKDGTIDVDGNVDLSFKNFSEIPVKFGKVSGNFTCRKSNLLLLKNSPYYVGGFFDCSENLITNLIGSPSEIVSTFYCNHNYNLISLEGMTLEIGGDFYCAHNRNLTKLDSVSNIEGIICIEGSGITDTSDFIGYCEEIKK